MLYYSYAVNGNLVLIYKNPKFTILAIALQIVFLLFFRIYDIRLIDSSLDLVFRGAGSLFLSNIGLAVGMLLLIKDIPLSLRLVTVYLPLNILVILGYRVIYRIMFSYHIKGDDEGVLPRTVVYGAGEIGLQLSRQHFKKKLPYNLLGFVDDDQTKCHSIVGGLTVLGGLDNLSSILRAKEAEVLIIAITDLSVKKMKQALDTAKRIGLETKIVPSLFELEDERKVPSI